LYKIGTCNNCGACCYVYSHTLKRFHVCEAYTTKSRLHCSVYDKRPKECREFPTGPTDLERVAKWCTLKFTDDQGRIVDIDKNVKLSRI
jgi:uncharacterized cysteine cluster protein YcgN (CxxCxxCC family)